MAGLPRTIGLILIAVVLTVFFVQNLATIEVAFFTWSITAPRAVVFLLIFALGWLTAYLAITLQPKRRPDAAAAEPQKGA